MRNLTHIKIHWMRMLYRVVAAWTIVYIKMTKTTCNYERVAGIPAEMKEQLQPILSMLKAEEVTTVDPGVKKDLAAYHSFLEGVTLKVQRATTSLLEKPKVRATLEGKSVASSTTMDLNSKLLKVTKMLQELHLEIGNVDLLVDQETRVVTRVEETYEELAQRLTSGGSEMLRMGCHAPE